jgi:transposase
MRMNEALTLIGFLLGGEAGARATQKLAMKTSPDTLLRRVRHAALPVTVSPRVLGVDDFAFRKGQPYGTILVDLEKHRVIDLLPDREAETLPAWPKRHTGVEVISRSIRGRCVDELREWLIKAGGSGLPEFRRFARGLTVDL